MKKLLGIMVAVAVMALLASPALAEDPQAVINVTATVAGYVDWTPGVYNIELTNLNPILGTADVPVWEEFGPFPLGSSSSNCDVTFSLTFGADLTLLNPTNPLWTGYTIETQYQPVVTAQIDPDNPQVFSWQESNTSWSGTLMGYPGLLFDHSANIRLNRKGLSDPAGNYGGKTVTLTLTAP